MLRRIMQGFFVLTIVAQLHATSTDVAEKQVAEASLNATMIENDVQVKKKTFFQNHKKKLIVCALAAGVVVGGVLLLDYTIKNNGSRQLDAFEKELEQIKGSCVGADNRLQQEYDLLGKKIAGFDVNDKNLERQIELRKWKREQARVWNNESDIKFFDKEINIIKDGIKKNKTADDIFQALRMQSESGS